MAGREDFERGDTLAVVVPAAGAGVRMGASRPKQYLEIGGRPIVALTLAVFEQCRRVGEVVLVVPPEDVPYCRRDIVERFGLSKVSRVVPGGKVRRESVLLGLRALTQEPGIVMIHDGVRPFFGGALLERLLAASALYRAVVPGLAPRETVKSVDTSGKVRETIERSGLRLIQTPQLFRYVDIRQAHERAQAEGWTGVTDDAMLVERLGVDVMVVEGSEMNIKITSPMDLDLARSWLGEGPARSGAKEGRVGIWRREGAGGERCA